jgi:hypothetical protein
MGRWTVGCDVLVKKTDAHILRHNSTKSLMTASPSGEAEMIAWQCIAPV